MSLEPTCSLFCSTGLEFLPPLSHDIERVSVSSSPCIGGGEELLVVHIELTHWRGCKIHGGDEVGWWVGKMVG